MFRFTIRDLLWLTVVLGLVAVMAYSFSYFSLVRPEPIDVLSLGGEKYVYAHYAWRDFELRFLFYPANQLDRSIRREFWETDNCTAPGSLWWVRSRD